MSAPHQRSERWGAYALLTGDFRGRRKRSASEGSSLPLVQKIPVEDRCLTDSKRIFCRVFEVKHGNRCALQCQYGAFKGFYRIKIWTTILQAFPIKLQCTERVTIENLLFGKLRTFSSLLSSSMCAMVVKGTVL